MSLTGNSAYPEDAEHRIRDLEAAYREEFFDFYRKKKSEDQTLYSSEIHNAFDRVWEEKHPEFFDIDRLFAGGKG